MTDASEKLLPLFRWTLGRADELLPRSNNLTYISEFPARHCTTKDMRMHAGSALGTNQEVITAQNLR